VSCCGGCQDKNTCATDRACCLECHFAMEERELFPFLPDAAQQALRWDHDMLRARGFPHAEVTEHSHREMRLYRRYCPAELVAQVETDHQAHADDRLRSRSR
jgi:hypothetical protein